MCIHKLSKRDILVESFRMLFHNQIKNRLCNNCKNGIELSGKGIKRKNVIDSVVISILLILFGVTIYVMKNKVINVSLPIYIIVIALYLFLQIIIRYIVFCIALNHLEFVDRRKTGDGSIS